MKKIKCFVNKDDYIQVEDLTKICKLIHDEVEITTHQNDETHCIILNRKTVGKLIKQLQKTL